MQRNILVTGGNGQLGLSLKKMTDSYVGYKFIYTDINELDVTDYDALQRFFRLENPYAVLHFAAYTAVDNAEKERLQAEKVNSTSTKLISSLCGTYGTKLIFISTDYVFDGKKSSPYKPQDKTNPLSVYGTTKARAEEYALSLCEDCTVIRTSWLYSEFGRNFVKTILNLSETKRELNVVFDQTGSPCYAEDLAKAVLMCLERVKGKRILHFANEGVCSWYDFARKIVELSGNECRVNAILSEQYPTLATRPSYSVLDKSETKSFLDMEIPHWEDSLKRCIKILRDEKIHKH